ncbi:MAG: hypothetical protein JKX85_13270, partial [Phycisphaeraceae bacterium]|nr:hypothetical protein [Phycisphaeraceae bacterium]
MNQSYLTHLANNSQLHHTKARQPKLSANCLRWVTPLSVSLLVAIISLLSLENKALAVEQVKPFAVRAVHVTFRPRLHKPATYRTIIDQASKLKYNTFILNTGGVHASSYTLSKEGKIRFNRWPNQQVAELFAYARKAGLEPIFEVKVIGKQDVIINEMAKTHPGLLIPLEKGIKRKMLNPAYRFSDGKDAYDAVALPMLDQMIALYGDTPPRYMLLGIDEIPVEFIDECAKALNTTTPKLFAQLINRCTEHLLAKGITPILWGDMFLSEALSKPGHGVLGFDHDPRITSGHATFISQKKNPPSTLTAVNDLKNRDKIIIGDWHYGDINQGEYPSVDYFQTLGFKDVWGATWYDDKGIRAFAHYAAKRNCGGMIATSWHTTISPSVRHLFAPLLNNSSIYFHNPNFKPTELDLTYRMTPTSQTNIATAATEKRSGIFQFTTPQFSYKVQLPAGPKPNTDTVLIIRSEQTHKVVKTVPLAFDPTSHQLTAPFSMPKTATTATQCYGTILQWTDQQNGYMVQKIHPAFFNLTQHQPVHTATAKNNEWFSADFSALTAEQLSRGLIYAAGQIPQILNIEPPVIKVPPVNGALNCRATSAWVKNPGTLWQQIATQGMQLDITFKVTDSFEKKDHCALVTLGSYS